MTALQGKNFAPVKILYICKMYKVSLDSTIRLIKIKTSKLFSRKVVSYFLFSAPQIGSNILAGNLVYESKLQQFLKPAVGSHPRWVLCYRASSHGWAASIFHRRCDGKRNTVSIIKVGQYVFGGYTDISWGKRIYFPYSLL